ncbi:DUF58 domain-containing protein [Pseudalkalibacillus caeni]|uniref:DUF58 domain-containing protein n=1 Tax=Exobacillus caeni TaxID=2574798 RepID=A0A5R9F689_9BACL|nr:DUF58 domain-containing protein [Pseudalkalibacillus caeni]TLS35315.1 DUF58 domain-containing protein [Pseudalkalibacillus caeni]
MRKFRFGQNRILKFIFLLILVLSTFAYAMFQGGFVSWFLFYSFIPLVVYTFFLLFYPMSNLEVEREVKVGELTEGQELEVTIRITRENMFPLFYLIVQDELPRRLRSLATGSGDHYQKGALALLLPMFKKHLSFTYKIKAMPRGEYYLDAISCKTGDMFGFVQKERTINSEHAVYVLPSYQELNWVPYKRNLSGSKQSSRQANFDVTTAVSVREYVPGDKLSWIDWKATAKSNKLLTKEFERQISQDFMVFLDRTKVHYQEEDSPLFERAVRLTASIANAALNQNSMLGLVSAGKDYSVLSVNGGKAQKRRIFHHLAKIWADGQTPFSTIIKREAHHFPAGTGMIVISPSLEKSLTAVLQELVSRKVQVEFFYISDNTFRSLDDQNALMRLRKYGVHVFEIAGNDFNEALKAGGNRATS